MARAALEMLLAECGDHAEPEPEPEPELDEEAAMDGEEAVGGRSRLARALGRGEAATAAEEESLLGCRGGGSMGAAAVLRTLRDGSRGSQPPDADDGGRKMSTSMFRIHQYNSDPDGLQQGGRWARSAMSKLGQLLARCCPMPGLITTLFSGTSTGIPGLHADLGLVTVAPKSSAAGLLVYSRGRWKLVEAEMAADDVVVFTGHTLGWLTRGHYRPLLHGVRTMALRRSLIFFLRSDAEAPLSRAAPPEHDQRAEGGRCGEGDEWHTETECTAGELLRGFHAVRVERRIPVRRTQGFVCAYAVCATLS